MCSRIRLARNLADFPFSNRSSRTEKVEIESHFKSAVSSAGMELTYFDVNAMNALVIDDSRAMRTIIRGLLKTIGFEVHEAADGAEALQVLDVPGSSFDLILVDWNMPVLDGLEFVKQARARGAGETARIVMVTTENEVGRMAEALDVGVDEYVMKPFTRDILMSKLESLGLVVV
jgi:two-component system chemotaxis response regulator CheY